jgi:DNA-binding response OmpR family regulator
MGTDAETISRACPTNEVEGQPLSTQDQTARKIILVVDDSLVFRQAVVLKLRGYGYDVMTAEDGSAAVAAVGRMKPDLILLDINFPPDVANGGGLGWDGFLILQWLRRTGGGANVPVIAVTGGDLDLYDQRCKEAGILELLAKPLDFEMLAAKIRAVLHQPELETKAPPPPPPSFEPVRRILFVDDDSPWRQMAIQNLSQHGYEVVTTHTAENALSEAAQIRPDLMILDLKLEKATGVSVMSLLLAAHPSVPLLVYAGLAVRDQEKRVIMDLGASQILQKRSMEELLEAVQLVSQQPRPSAPQTKPQTTASRAKVGFDTILIVENDLTFSESLRGYLESHSFYVTCVSNATEALRQMACADFDLILTEMVLPGPSGEHFYHEVERTTPELCRRFIFMTGHDAEPRTDNFIRRVRACMLWKPFPPEDLLSATQIVKRKDWLARTLAHSRSEAAA